MSATNSAGTVVEWAGAVITLAVVAAALLGVANCISYDRERERACMARGGHVGRVNGNVACLRSSVVDSIATTTPR